MRLIAIVIFIASYFVGNIFAEVQNEFLASKGLFETTTLVQDQFGDNKKARIYGVRVIEGGVDKVFYITPWPETATLAERINYSFHRVGTLEENILELKPSSGGKITLIFSTDSDTLLYKKEDVVMPIQKSFTLVPQAKRQLEFLNKVTANNPRPSFQLKRTENPFNNILIEVFLPHENIQISSSQASYWIRSVRGIKFGAFDRKFLTLIDKVAGVIKIGDSFYDAIAMVPQNESLMLVWGIKTSGEIVRFGYTSFENILIGVYKGFAEKKTKSFHSLFAVPVRTNSQEGALVYGSQMIRGEVIICYENILNTGDAVKRFVFYDVLSQKFYFSGFNKPVESYYFVIVSRQDKSKPSGVICQLTLKGGEKVALLFQEGVSGFTIIK